MGVVLFGGVFTFTAIDIFNKESDVLLRPTLGAIDVKAFLDHCMSSRFNYYTEIIQTYGGSEFKVLFSDTVSV